MAAVKWLQPTFCLSEGNKNFLPTEIYCPRWLLLLISLQAFCTKFPRLLFSIGKYVFNEVKPHWTIYPLVLAASCSSSKLWRCGFEQRVPSPQILHVPEVKNINQSAERVAPPHLTRHSDPRRNNHYLREILKFSMRKHIQKTYKSLSGWLFSLLLRNSMVIDEAIVTH